MSKLDTAYKAAYVINSFTSYAMTAAFIGMAVYAVVTSKKNNAKPETPATNTNTENIENK